MKRAGLLSILLMLYDTYCVNELERVRSVHYVELPLCYQSKIDTTVHMYTIRITLSFNASNLCKQE